MKRLVLSLTAAPLLFLGTVTSAGAFGPGATPSHTGSYTGGSTTGATTGYQEGYYFDCTDTSEYYNGNFGDYNCPPGTVPYYGDDSGTGSNTGGM